MLVKDLCNVHTQAGHECAIAAFAPPDDAFTHDASELFERGTRLFFPASALRTWRRVVHYRRAAKEFRPDVIFAHSVLPSFYGRFMACAARDLVPYISVLHAAENYNTASLKLSEMLTRHRVDAIVSVSELAALDYQASFRPSLAVITIRNGIDINGFRRGKRVEARLCLGVAEETRVVLQIGRIYDIKQQIFSLTVLKPWLERGQATLLFVGLTEDASYEKRLRQQVKDWGLEQAVLFLGSRSDIPDLLAAADLFLMPSRQESQGIALIEALASGVPIIASDIEPFRFAEKMPGVRIVGLSDMEKWRCGTDALLKSGRYYRDLEGFSVERTADQYLLAAVSTIERRRNQRSEF